MGHLWTFGSNWYGQLGLGTDFGSHGMIPTAVKFDHKAPFYLLCCSTQSTIVVSDFDSCIYVCGKARIPSHDDAITGLQEFWEPKRFPILEYVDNSGNNMDIIFIASTIEAIVIAVAPEN